MAHRVHPSSEAGARKGGGDLGLAYSMAIVMKLRDPLADKTTVETQAGGGEHPDTLAWHRRLVRGLLAAHLNVGILAATEETPDKIVLVVDATGVTLHGETHHDAEEADAAAPTPLLRVHKRSFKGTLHKERHRARVDAIMRVASSGVTLDPAQVEHLTPAEEIVLTNRIILRVLNRLNVDDRGVLCEFDILNGGARSTPLERIIDNVFPLQDEEWNKRFLDSLHLLGRDGGHNGLTSAVRHFWRAWVTQTPEDMLTEDLRARYGDRVSTYINFLLYYRSWLGVVTIIATVNYAIVRFSSWSAYLITSSMVGVFICTVWGPRFTHGWTVRFKELSVLWNRHHVLPPEAQVPNPLNTRKMLEMAPEDRARRRTLVKIATIIVVIINLLVLCPVSLFFTQWYVYGKMSPTCECCRFLMDSGIGNGTRAMLQVLESQWPEECYEEYIEQARAFPLDLRNQPETCSLWVTCFAQSAATVGTDRWLYILIQGIAMGLILDVVQTAVFRVLTRRLTIMESHEYLEDFTKFLIRKQFFFVWVNMFCWYLTLTFVYVPFGAEVQDWLSGTSLSILVPPWGFRPNKILLDEAFLAPMVATAFINLFIETFVPSLVAKLGLKAKTNRRKVISKASLSRVALAMSAAKNVASLAHAAHAGGTLNPLSPRSSSPRRNESPPLDPASANKDRGRGTELRSFPLVAASVKQAIGNDSPPMQLFTMMENAVCMLPDVAGMLHYYSVTPDENEFDAKEVVVQSVLPAYDENDDYLNLVLQIGYLCMFTSAWGLLPLAAYLRTMFSYRGTCYRLLFACRRGVPLAALKQPSEWHSTVFLTFLLGIPVVCAQITLSTGSYDTFLRLAGFDSDCGLHREYDPNHDSHDAEPDDLDDIVEAMMPDFYGCEGVTVVVRLMVAFILEHACFGLFTAVYMHSEQQAAVHRGRPRPSAVPCAVAVPATESLSGRTTPRGHLGKRGAVVAPASADRSDKPGSHELDTESLNALFDTLDTDKDGKLSFEEVRALMRELVEHPRGAEVPARLLDDMIFTLVRHTQDQGGTPTFSSETLVSAYERCVADPLMRPFLGRCLATRAGPAS